jgi:hypothetical protein
MGLFKDCGCGCGGRKSRDKFLISLVSALIFFLIASPETYQLTRQLFGSWVSGPTGCASTLGLALHAVVFFLVTLGLMHMKSNSLTSEGGGSCGA